MSDKHPIDKLRIINKLLLQGATKDELIDAAGTESNLKYISGIGWKNSGIKYGYYWPEKFHKLLDIEQDDIIIREKKDGKFIYRYSDKAMDVGFNLFSLSISEQETEELLSFVEFYERINGLSDAFLFTTSTIKKLVENHSFLNYDDRLENLGDNKIMNVSFGEVYNKSGNLASENLHKIISPIINKQVLNLKYEPFSGNIRVGDFSPYHIVEYNSRWNLIGSWHTDQNNTISNLSLDRINEKSISIAENIEFKNNSTDFNKLLSKTVGSSINWQNPEIITLKIKVSDKLKNHFANNPIIYNQLNLNDGVFLYKDIIKTIELKNKLRSYGSEITVLEPESFANEIIEDHNKLMENYSIINTRGFEKFRDNFDSDKDYDNAISNFFKDKTVKILLESYNLKSV